MKMHETERSPLFKSDLQLYCPPVSMESEALIIPLCFLRPGDQKLRVTEKPPARLQRIFSQVFGVSTYKRMVWQLMELCSKISN